MFVKVVRVAAFLECCIFLGIASGEFSFNGAIQAGNSLAGMLLGRPSSVKGEIKVEANNRPCKGMTHQHYLQFLFGMPDKDCDVKPPTNKRPVVVYNPSYNFHYPSDNNYQQWLMQHHKIHGYESYREWLGQQHFGPLKPYHPEYPFKRLDQWPRPAQNWNAPNYNKWNSQRWDEWNKRPYQTWDRPGQNWDKPLGPHQEWDQPGQNWNKPFGPHQKWDQPGQNWDRPLGSHQKWNQPGRNWNGPGQNWNNKPYNGRPGQRWWKKDDLNFSINGKDMQIEGSINRPYGGGGRSHKTAEDKKARKAAESRHEKNEPPVKSDEAKKARVQKKEHRPSAKTHHKKTKQQAHDGVKSRQKKQSQRHH